MKFIFIITLFMGCSYIGIITSKNYSKREVFYNELIMFCNVLISNIRFNKNKLRVVVEDYINIASIDMKNYLLSYINDDIEDIYFISKYDNAKIKEFFIGLGNFDTSGEIGYIENYKLYFNDCYAKSVEENKKYGALYSKLGVIAGLVLLILFI